MTQEEKQLLFKDLCARLPYGVKINIRNDYTFTMENVEMVGHHLSTASYCMEYKGLRPYLRPMSSMTEEELDECVKYSGIRELECPQIETFEDRLLWAIKMFSTDYKSVDWLNEHHFDYRGLIEKGLALEAPEGMYKQ